MTDHSFAYDIETEPAPEVAERLFDRQEFEDQSFPQLKLAANIKKPETIERYHKDWQAAKAKYETDAARNERVRLHEEAENQRYNEYLQGSLLDATRSKVCAIGFHSQESGDYCLHVDRTISEIDLLVYLWARCKYTQDRGGMIYTASGTQFDLRFPWRRSIILGVRIPCLSLNWYRGRAYPDQSFFDASEIWGAGEYGFRVKVRNLAAGFGLDGKTGDHGATFWKLLKEDPEAARQYCIADARIAWELGQRFKAARIWVNRNMIERG
jgi:hypothetical protein